MADKPELLKRNYALKSEISRLKRDLSSLNSSKRQLYQQRDKIWETFSPILEKIRDLKGKRDEHTANVKQLKNKRESESTVVKSTLDDVRKFRAEKAKKSKELGVNKTASLVASEIDRLEFKMETEAIPFERERELNKIIKEKKIELEKIKTADRCG